MWKKPYRGKGSICVKIFGDSLNYMEAAGDGKSITFLKGVRGISDLGVIKNIGQPELDIDLDQDKMALYGVATADANAVIRDGHRRESSIPNYMKAFRNSISVSGSRKNSEKNQTDIGNIMVPTQSGSKVPIREIATITKKTAPCLIFRDDNERYAALKFSVRAGIWAARSPKPRKRQMLR